MTIRGGWHSRMSLPSAANTPSQKRSAIRVGDDPSDDACSLRSGSIHEISSHFKSCRINDLWFVGLNRASWNQVGIWLRRVEALRA